MKENLNNLISIVASVNYTMPIDFLFGHIIREYDLAKANITALHFYGKISDEDYNRYSAMEKTDREVAIGMLIRNNRMIYDHLRHGIESMKIRFVEQNSISSRDILAIKNDALFLIDVRPTLTEFQYAEQYKFEFKCKNTYSGYMKIRPDRGQTIELYSSIDTMNQTHKIDVKGINDNALLNHEKGFLKLIKIIFHSIEFNSFEDTLTTISNLYQEYINLKLPLEYYREFNSNSLFRYKGGIYGIYYSEFPPAKDKFNIDISYNLNILRDIYRLVMTFIHNQI